MQVDRKLPGNTNPDCHRATLKTCQCTLKSHHGQIFPGCSHKDSPEANPMWSFHKVSKCRWAGFGGNGCFGRPTTLPNIYIKAKISCLLPAVLQEVSFPSPGFMLTPHLLPFFTTSLYPLHSFKQCHFPHTTCLLFLLPSNIAALSLSHVSHRQKPAFLSRERPQQCVRTDPAHTLPKPIKAIPRWCDRAAALDHSTSTAQGMA